MLQASGRLDGFNYQPQMDTVGKPGPEQQENGKSPCGKIVARPDLWLILRPNHHGKEQTCMPTCRTFALVLFIALTTAGLAARAQSDKTSAMTSTAIEWNSLEAKTNATGSSRKFFEGPTATLDVLECHASTLNPGATNHEILRRPNDEVIIVKEGTIEAFVGDKWVRVGPGSVIFNAANTPQSMRNVGDTPATYHVIVIRTAAPKPSAEK